MKDIFIKVCFYSVMAFTIWIAIFTVYKSLIGESIIHDIPEKHNNYNYRSYDYGDGSMTKEEIQDQLLERQYDFEAERIERRDNNYAR